METSQLKFLLSTLLPMPVSFTSQEASTIPPEITTSMDVFVRIKQAFREQEIRENELHIKLEKAHGETSRLQRTLKRKQDELIQVQARIAMIEDHTFRRFNEDLFLNIKEISGEQPLLIVSSNNPEHISDRAFKVNMDLIKNTFPKIKLIVFATDCDLKEMSDTELAKLKLQRIV